MFKKLTKRIISGLSALAMLTSSALSLVPITAGADADADAAHTINVFDIDIKAGADHYSTYTPDDPSDTGVTVLNDVYVWQADKANEGHKFVYNIKLSISGEGNDDSGEMTKKGFIEIRIPEHILKFKGTDSALAMLGGTYSDTAELPVPDEVLAANSDTDHDFVYRYDAETHEYVIYNVTPVSAGVVYEFPVAYVMNKNTWEYQDLEASEPFSAKVTLRSWEHDDPSQVIELDQTTREIPVYIDTGAILTNTTKKAEQTLMTAAVAMDKTGLTNLDENYRYALWSVTSDITGVTQRYSLELTDTPAALTGVDGDGVTHTVNGETVAVKMGGTWTDGNTASVSGLTASGKRTDYVLTRYLYESDGENEGVKTLEEAPKDAVYTATNTADVKLTPADGQDNYTSDDSTVPFKFDVKNPVWKPIETNYGANKWGLYNNGASRVGNKTNVSSYELSKLLSDEAVSGLQYETYSMAHAYGKTITDLNNEIKALILPEEINADGTAQILAGDRTYSFDSTSLDYTVTTDENTETRSAVKSYPLPLTLLNMQEIVAQDIADSYYGQQALDYIFDDKTFDQMNISTSSEKTPLDGTDYKIDSVFYNYIVKSYVYDDESMEFSAGKENQDLSSDSTENTLEFWVYNNGAAEPVLAGKYNIADGTANIVDNSLIKSLSGSNIVFADTANITGYQIRTSNKYFYVELTTKPSITLKPSEKIKAIVEPIINGSGSEKKTAIQNTCNWTVKNSDTVLLNTNKTATDYIADIVRTSDISKKALGERTTIRGQDGNIYKSKNDTLAGEYELAWQTKISETADGVEVNGSIQNNVPVPQQSGIFYDLLPSHSDIIEDSVNVYIDASGDVNENTPSLSPASFEVLDRIDDYNGSGKKLLIIKINAPCDVSYTVTYVTVHTHDDIQDYGSFALNTVAYQTGNADIGDGYADDGGNYAVTMSGFIKGLDPDNGNAKRFIYAEATEDILALFPISSGIYKKVATSGDPVYRKTGLVHNGETYTYSIRMKNDSSTRATDIAILDSIENYRTVLEYDDDGNVKLDENGKPIKRYNFGLAYDRDWYGELVGFDLSGVEDKMGDKKNDLKLILYVGDGPDDIVDLETETYSNSSDRMQLLKDILSGAENPAAAKWHTVENWRDLSAFDLSKVSAFIVYTGSSFVLPKGDSMSFTVKMKAPDEVIVDGEADVESGVFLPLPSTNNNVYRSFTATSEDASGQDLEDIYFYTHYDYTQVQYSTVGTLKFCKRDSDSDKPVSGVTFSLSGISDYGTVYDETLTSDSSGYVIFKNLERGTYTLTESRNDPDHLLDTTPRTVKVDPHGNFTFITVDGQPMLKVDNDGKPLKDQESVSDGSVSIDENGNFIFVNEPRYHGDLSFSKVDSLSGNGISGTKFTLDGISMYNTRYDNIEAVSDGNGNVVFEDIEKGDYDLTEIVVSDGYLPPKKNVYKVTSSGKTDLVFKITGENAVYEGTEYQIKNTPTAEMTLQKVDALTKDTLDTAVFTLTADSSLNETIANAVANLPDGKTGWVKDGSGNWVKTITSSGAGKYIFTYLPEGDYTLTETTAPEHYKNNTTEYQIIVEKSEDGKRLVVKVPAKPEWSYVKVNSTGDGFDVVDAENAQYQRLTNDEEYDDGKTVIKSWIGGTTELGTFPKMHLSSQKQEADLVKVTINAQSSSAGDNWTSGLRKFIREKGTSNIKSFVRSYDEPPADAVDCNDTSFEDEDGQFKIWYSSGTLYWWSDADVIYMPPNSKMLFQGTQITDLDLSPFNFEKVKSLSHCFQNSKIQNINLSSMVNTPDLLYLSDCFSGNTTIEKVDLSNWVSSSDNLEGTQYALLFRSMFNGCTNLKSVDMSNLVCTHTGNIRQMFNNCYKLESVRLGKNITFVSYEPLDSTAELKPYMGDGTWSVHKSDNFSIGFKGMFNNCYAANFKELDLTAFNIASMTASQKTSLYDMLANCSNLEKVYVTPKWKLGTLWAETNNFYNKDKLTGGLGSNSTTISSKAPQYAKIDGGASDPGYFTDITDPNQVSKIDAIKIIQSLRGLDKEQAESYYDYLCGNGDGSSQSEPEPIDDEPSGDTPDYEAPDYPKFQKKGSSKVKETDAVDDDKLNKKSFDFEYVTAENGTAVDGKTGEYTVPETLYMTVSEIIREGDKYYTCSQRYKYDDTLTATWTKVSTTAPVQWYCEMKVFNADDVLYAWEDEVKDFNSTALANTAIKTEGRASKPVITNSKGSVGGLELKKALDGTDSEKFSGDTFRFKVTMTNADGTAYTMLPFDENGVAYFDVKPNAKGDDKIVISGIPVGCKYTVEELGTSDEYTQKSTNGIEGTITENKTLTAKIVNTINVTNLTLTKNAELYKKKEGSADFVKVTDSTDADLNEWLAEDFKFTVTFTNLVKGQKYSYQIGDTVYTDKIVGNDRSAETAETITLHGGEMVTFKDIPVGTAYRITEVSQFEGEDWITYDEAAYSISGGNEVSVTTGKASAEQTLKATGDAVTFINVKRIDETQIPEYVSVTVDKQWFSEKNLPVHWMTNADGKAVKFSYDETKDKYVEDPDNGAYIPMDSENHVLTNYPSFLKVYLGRALKVGEGDGAVYLDITTGYSSVSLNVKGDWSYTFTDLEKYGEITLNGKTEKYPYVYFVTEVVPVGFSNTNPGTDKEKIGTGEFFAAKGSVTDSDELSFTLTNKEDPTYSLSICKLVTGNFGNKAKDYTFEIEFTDAAGKPLSGTGFTMQVTDLNDSTSVRNRTYTLEVGKLSVDIPHGKKVTFLSLPQGTHYKITEINADGYAIHSGTYTGDALNVEAADLTGGKEQKGALDSNKDYLYINERQGNIPTGIALSMMAPVIVTVLIFGYFAFYCIQKRKRESS